MISEFVEYVKQAWNNKPNVSSPLNADRLNHMEDGIKNNSNKIKEIVPAVNELTENMDITTKSIISNYGTLYFKKTDKIVYVFSQDPINPNGDSSTILNLGTAPYNAPSGNVPITCYSNLAPFGAVNDVSVWIDNKNNIKMYRKSNSGKVYVGGMYIINLD